MMKLFASAAFMLTAFALLGCLNEHTASAETIDSIAGTGMLTTTVRLVGQSKSMLDSRLALKSVPMVRCMSRKFRTIV